MDVFISIKIKLPTASMILKSGRKAVMPTDFGCRVTSIKEGIVQTGPMGLGDVLGKDPRVEDPSSHSYGYYTCYISAGSNKCP